MSQDKDAEIAALKKRIVELEERMALADNDRAAWELYDREGVLPPRTCEMEEAPRLGVTFDGLISRMQERLAEKRQGDAA